MKFKNFLKDLDEEMTSGDVASVDSRLGDKPARTQGKHKGKRCKIHKRFDCLDCTKGNNE